VQFNLIQLPPDASREDYVWAVRLNGFGSSYYFIKVILKKNRLTPGLHLPICQSLEKEHLKDVKEYPRDHFKSTIATEGNPIWRVLPFSARDEDKFREFHAKGWFVHPAIDEFIRWMYFCHNIHRRTLLVSENLENSMKLGTRIRRHFESGDVFRTIYPEILPGTQEAWTSKSLQIHVPGGKAAHGEGTFDFIGMGGALQSRHYNAVVEDDLVGIKTVESPSIMEKAMDYHQLLVGAFDQLDPDHEADELIIGNRWGYHDLNSQVRENEPWFHFETHSALGGCCDLHPAGVPIFPEEFSIAKLERFKKRLGTYKFSCQFLNNPCSPEDTDFRPEWLGKYMLIRNTAGEQYIRHEVRDGLIRRDIRIEHLKKALVTDPTHSQNAAQGRCRHAIVVLGISSEGNYYLLDCWAKHCGYEEYFRTLFQMARKWGLHRVGFETSAGQGFGAHHIQYYAGVHNYRLSIVPLKGEVELEDGTISTKKEWRIRGVLGPICEFGRFFTQVWPDGKDRFQDFIGEYSEFPRGRFVDILDALAYAPQILRTPMSTTVAQELRRRNRQMAAAMAQPYSAGVGGSYVGSMGRA